ncbi:MAG: acetyl-CoA carboxylase biotin carboxylase subunit [Clostridium sp.]|uniref:acetyl-CoA carboxylase biotin carboxylase subunit n=1 Tax=Clostridium sp. TaxID=1506 RepID=UPI00306B9AE0
MFKKILIANRGEIAVRIIRACKEMGIQTVAVYSEGDKDALHTQMADECVCIGPSPSKDSYLNENNILSATILKGAEAIHPGFGFLSENNRFAKMCEECNIKFIGPTSDNIRNMGNKSKARQLMEEARVPVVPGSKGIVEDEEQALRVAKEIGYPVMIKASSGGGGKGIRVVNNESQLISDFNAAKREAKVSFNDDSMYIEKFVEKPRHIEIQLIADNYGNTVYLGERECSVQRKNQKVLEEAPSVIVNEEMRIKMGEVAVKAAKSIGYVNAGTIEFLVDKNMKFYFMEMNTRIQVEHPVTEMVTGIDLIKEQIKIAYGEKLSFSQEDIRIKGHSIECRINAEDPYKNFMPCPGLITNLYVPGGNGIRLDSAVYQGYKIPHTYDSMIGKLIVHGRDRNEAISKMKRALGEFIIEGVSTNIDLQLSILSNDNFVNGEFDTSFLEMYLKNNK